MLGPGTGKSSGNMLHHLQQESLRNSQQRKIWGKFQGPLKDLQLLLLLESQSSARGNFAQQEYKTMLETLTVVSTEGRHASNIWW